MKWLRAIVDGQPRWGIIEGDEAVWMSADPFCAPQATGARSPLTEVQWLAPMTRANQMLALWNNFAASATKNGWSRPPEPLWFIKSGNSHAGHGADIPAPPPGTGRVAYEGELAIVIGRRAHRLDLASAKEAIFGYTCANDVTAIELLQRDPSFPQWSRAKGFDGFGILGPVIDTAFDPAGASVITRVDGRERQNYPLSDMFFNPVEIVSAISQDITLEPGDVILCGTSLGVLPMKPGARVEIQIDGIGTLSNTYASTTV